MSEPALLRNSIRTPDGTVLTSRYRHNYQTHLDENGLTYMVDGGLSYIRRNVHAEAPYEELSVYDNEPHAYLRKEIKWGRLTGNIGAAVEYIPISDMSKAHIMAIIKDGYKGSVVSLMERELEYRHLHETADEAELFELKREASYGN